MIALVELKDTRYDKATDEVIFVVEFNLEHANLKHVSISGELNLPRKMLAVIYGRALRIKKCGN